MITLYILLINKSQLQSIVLITILVSLSTWQLLKQHYAGYNDIIKTR